MLSNCFESLIQVKNGRPRFYLINLQWKIFGLTWKQVISVLEMSTLFCLGCNVNIFGTCLVNNLHIPKISDKTVWTKPELMLIDLAICKTIRLSHPKLYREWLQFIHQRLRFLNNLIEGHLLCCPFFCLNSTTHFFSVA